MLCHVVYSVCLTLIDLEEGLGQFAREQRFWQISEVLLEHVCDIIGRLALVADTSPVRPARLVHLTQSLDSGFNSRFPEKTHLDRDQRTQRVRSQTPMSCETEGFYC